MLSTIIGLKSDPDFRALPVNAQIDVAYGRLLPELQSMPDFRALSPEAQELVRKSQALKAVTFNDPSWEGQMSDIGSSAVLGGSGDVAKKDFYQGFNALFQGSGAMGWLDEVLHGAQGPVVTQDRQRLLTYFKTVDRMSSRDSWADKLGSILGSFADVGMVSSLTAPLTKAAAIGIEAGARGTTAAALKTAVETGGDIPALLKPSLAFYGPTVAREAIEALPYFITSERQKVQSGQPTAASQGIGEVATSIGLNAALDFVASNAIVWLKRAAFMGKKIFGKGSVPRQHFDTPEQFQAFVDQTATGTRNPQDRIRMTDIDKDYQECTENWIKFARDGIATPEQYPKERAAYFGIREGTPWGTVTKTLDDGTTQVSYRLWQLGKDGKTFEPHFFSNFSDLEDHIAYINYQAYSKLDNAAKQEFLQRGGGYLIARGELINKQLQTLGSDSLKAVKPMAEGAQVPSAQRRIVMTKSEADALASSGNGIHVVQAEIPIKGQLLDNATRGQLDLLRGTGPAVVAPSANPNAVFFGFSEATPEAYQAATKLGQDLVNAGEYGSLAEARASTLLTQGFDHMRLPDGTTEFFNTRDMRLIGTPDDVLLTAKKATGLGSVTDKVIVQESGKLVQKPEAAFASDDTTVLAMQKVIRDGVDPANLQTVAKGYLDGHGVQGVNVSVHPTDASDFSFTKEGNVLHIYAPNTTPATFDEENKAVGSFMSGLAKAASDAGGSATARGSDYWAAKLASAPKRFSLPGVSDPLAWAQAAVDKLGGVIQADGDTFAVLLPRAAGPEFKGFANQDDLVNYVARRVLDPATMQNDLIRQGVKLTRVPSQAETYMARSLSDGKLLARGSLDDVLDSISYVPSSLDRAYGPSSCVFRPDGNVEMNLMGQTVVKSQSEAMQLMSKFKDESFLNHSMNMLSSDKGTIDFTPSGSYYVYSSRQAAGQEFSSIADARRWLEAGSSDLKAMQDIATKKFLNLSLENGFYVISAKDNVYRVRTLDEVNRIFRKYPDIEQSAPNILDTFDPSIETSVHDAVLKWQTVRYTAGFNEFHRPPDWPDFSMVKSPSAYMIAREQTSEMNAWVEDAAKRTHNTAFLEKFRALAAGEKRARDAHFAFANGLEAVFKDSNGKMLSDESMRKIFYHNAMNSEQLADDLRGQYLQRYGKELAPLTQDESIAAGRLKEAMDALSVRFHIDSNKLLNNYMPFLRDWVADPANAEKLAMAQSAQELVDYAYKGAPPKELKFWAENERVSELTNFFVKDNALEVALLYSAQGHKKLYMNEAWKDIDQFLTRSPLANDPGWQSVTKRINFYRMQVMGSYHSPDEEMLSAFGEKLFSNIARSPIGKACNMSEPLMREKGKNILNSFLSLTYFSDMGWKPWLAIRNAISGPFIQGGGRLGLQWVFRGWDDIMDRGEPYVEYLRRIGVISERPPLVDQIFSHSTKLGRFAENSMRWFKNSDDLGRAMVYRGAEMKFENAYDLMQSGKIASRNLWENLSGLDVMDPECRDFVWSRIGKNATVDSVAEAKHEFASRLMRETQFDYTAATAPAMFRTSAVGRVFGQFGTYSAGYRANLARMFKNSSWPRRLQQFATYAAICGSLWGTFHYFHIKTNDFIPVLPSVFTGGPAFDIGLNIIRAVDVNSYSGKQARAELKTQLPQLIPGSAQYNYIKKAIDYSQQGNSYGAFLSLFGVSYLDN
jgi:hypothetical protein